MSGVPLAHHSSFMTIYDDMLSAATSAIFRCGEKIFFATLSLCVADTWHDVISSYKIQNSWQEAWWNIVYISPKISVDLHCTCKLMHPETLHQRQSPLVCQLSASLDHPHLITGQLLLWRLISTQPLYLPALCSMLHYIRCKHAALGPSPVRKCSKTELKRRQTEWSSSATPVTLRSVFRGGRWKRGSGKRGTRLQGWKTRHQTARGGKRGSGKVWKAKSPRYLTLLQVCYNSH